MATPEPAPQLAFDEPAIPDVMLESDSDADVNPVADLRRRRQQLQRRRMIVMGVSSVVLIAVGVELNVGLSGKQNAKLTKKDANARTAKARGSRIRGRRQFRRTRKAASGSAEKPADPITLKLVPEGAKIVIHLRPAELWRKTDSAEEFRACLGPLGIWLKAPSKPGVSSTRRISKKHCLP